MNKVITTTCVFCQGTGKNPHFTGTCPVCKGKGENQIRGKFMTCEDCRGSGQKGGTTLTCYTCGGLGMIPDTREVVAKAREEIRRAREEMGKERPARQRPEPQAMAGGEEFREKPEVKGNEQKLIDKLKAENKRLRKSRKSQGIESAIGAYCEDCAIGENRECWDIECALAPFSPVAATIG